MHISDLIHNDGCVSMLNTQIGSNNRLSEECLDDASIGTVLQEAITNVSDAEANLEVENSLINK